MKRFIILALFLFVILSAAYLIYREGSLPVDRSSKETKLFIIKKGDSLDTIAQNLSAEGLIRNRIVFYLIVKQLNIDKSIQAGDFRLSPSMDVTQIAKNLTHGTVDQWVTIIEGLRKEEIAQVLSTELGLPEIEFLQKAKEGYLFPDTYLFPRQATAQTIIDTMKQNFKTKYTATMRDAAAKHNLSEEDVIILASLLERESRLDSDRRTVAGILLKRYENDWPLQIDATVQYTLGYDEVEKTWWKKNLTVEDLEIDSPYNTYVNTGLPPGPISNPGISAIEAVVYADPNTPYWYYVSDADGKLHFAKTLEEHNMNVEKYVP